MPRDGANIYHRPPGTDGIADTTVESARYNAFVADVEQDLNTPRPIVAGGTGASSADGALDSLSAEKFKQVVTNWDTTVWRAGSFFALANATGIAPGGLNTHAFAGIAYYANATDFVLKATDLTDPANPVDYTRVMAAGVWSAWSRTGASGTSGTQLGEFTFDTGITFPPAAGTVRFNNAVQNSATEIFISHLTATGVDVTTSLPFSLRSGYELVVADKVDISKYKIFTITGNPVLAGSDIRVTAVLKTPGIDLVNAQRVTLTTAVSPNNVRYDIAQALTDPQQQQARQNIYAAPLDALAFNGLQLNGSFDIAQQYGNGFSISGQLNLPGYNVDNWYHQLIQATPGSTVFSVSQNDPRTFGGATFGNCYQNCCFIQAAAAANPVANGDRAVLLQWIEGYRWARLGFGSLTGNPSPVTIGFWICTSAPPGSVGTVAIGSYGATSRIHIKEFTTLTTNWEYHTATITPDNSSAANWLSTNGRGAALIFCFGGGGNVKSGTKDVWADWTTQWTTGACNNFFASGGNFVAITGVTVMPGNEAPSVLRAPLIMRPRDSELLLCRRHYWNDPAPTWMDYEGVSVGASANRLWGTYQHPVPMRLAPAVALPTFTLIGCAAPTLSIANAYGASFNGLSNVTAGNRMSMVQVSGTLTNDARL